MAGTPLQSQLGWDAYTGLGKPEPDAHAILAGSVFRRIRWRRRDRATRPGARFALSGIRPGSLSLRHLSRTAKLIDAPPHGVRIADVAFDARDYDLVVLHTSTPSFATDVAAVEALKAANPNLKIGLIGAKVAVEADKSLRAAPAIDFVARNEFDFTIKEVAEGRAPRRRQRAHLSQRGGRHRPQHRSRDAGEHGRAAVRDARLQARSRHRRIISSAISSTPTSRSTRAAAANRAAPSASGRRRSADIAIAREASATSSRRCAGLRGAFPQVKEFFFDDDTFTDNLPRAEAHRQGARQARRHLVVQRQGQRAARDARRC